MPAPSKQGAQNYQRKITAKTAAYTITAEESGTLFTNRGATAAITFTLPSVTNLPVGTNYSFYGVVNAGFTVAVNGSLDNMTNLNDTGADSLTCTTNSLAIGAAIDVIWDGTSWLARRASGGPTYTSA